MTGRPHRRARRNLTLVVGSVAALAGVAAYTTQVAAHDAGSAGGDRSTACLHAHRRRGSCGPRVGGTVRQRRRTRGWRLDGSTSTCASTTWATTSPTRQRSVTASCSIPVKPEALVYADVDGSGSGRRRRVGLDATRREVLGIPRCRLVHDLDVSVLHAWVGLDNPAWACSPSPRPRRQHLPGLTGPRSGRPAHHSAVWAAAASGSDVSVSSRRRKLTRRPP